MFSNIFHYKNTILLFYYLINDKNPCRHFRNAGTPIQDNNILYQKECRPLNGF